MDFETRYEEKTQTMLDLLNKSKLNQKLKDEIEDDIFMDKFCTIKSLEEYLIKLEKEINNY